MTIYDEIACLQEVPPFAALSPVKQKLLAVVSEHAVYMAGDVIIVQGETGDAVYVLLDGVADVRIRSGGEDRLVRELGRNALFGEIAVMKNTPRMASVVARTMVQRAAHQERSAARHDQGHSRTRPAHPELYRRRRLCRRAGSASGIRLGRAATRNQTRRKTF